MKKFLLEYFTFNKGDRNGIIVLLFIISALLFFLSIVNGLIPENKEDFDSFIKLVADLEKAKKDALTKDNQETKTKAYSATEILDKSTIPSPDNVSRFAFNPNHLAADKWKALGLSDKQIKTILHYEEKGGHFYKNEDVKKIYGISENLYAQLEPYIQLAQKKDKDSLAKNWTTYKKDTIARNAYYSKKNEVIPKSQAKQLLEINLADTMELKNLKGIGSSFAKRILTYREKLGGFISLNQLHEIWGLDSETINSIVPQLTINTAAVRKISINHCSVSELKKHPYLSYNIANNIVLYRDRHGNFSKVQDIKQAVLVNEELFRKIAPYLTLD